jgi:hypothetical protein
MLILKNIDNIRAKKEKTLDELKILQYNPKDILGIFSGKDTNNIINYKTPQLIKLIKLKKLQLKICEWLKKEKPEKIQFVLNKERQKLCPKCEGSLIRGDSDLLCDKDLKQYVFCDMMRQAISVIN